MTSMLKHKTGPITMALLITVFLIPALAGAAKYGGGHGGGDFKMMGRHKSPCGIWKNTKMVSDLGLDEEQVQKLKDADFDFREKQLALSAQVKGLHLKMEKAYSEDTVVDSDVLGLAGKISDLRGKLYVNSVQSRLTVNKILTPEQRKKLQTLAQERRAKRGGRGKHAMASAGKRFPGEQ